MREIGWNSDQSYRLETANDHVNHVCGLEPTNRIPARLGRVSHSSDQPTISVLFCLRFITRLYISFYSGNEVNYTVFILALMTELNLFVFLGLENFCTTFETTNKITQCKIYTVLGKIQLSSQASAETSLKNVEIYSFCETDVLMSSWYNLSQHKMKLKHKMCQCSLFIHLTN